MLNIPKSFVADSRSFRPCIRDPGWKKSDPGSGINIPGPQHCSEHCPSLSFAYGFPTWTFLYASPLLRLLFCPSHPTLLVSLHLGVCIGACPGFTPDSNHYCPIGGWGSRPEGLNTVVKWEHQVRGRGAPRYVFGSKDWMWTCFYVLNRQHLGLGIL